MYHPLYYRGNITQELVPVNRNLGRQRRKLSLGGPYSGERIKILREKLGKTAQDLESATKIPASTYLTYEKSTEPKFSQLVAIAEALGADPFWLAGIKKPRSDEQTGAGEEQFVDPASRLVYPDGMPTPETVEILAGYFYFRERRIQASMVFRSKGPPGNLGGFESDEPWADE